MAIEDEGAEVEEGGVVWERMCVRDLLCTRIDWLYTCTINLHCRIYPVCGAPYLARCTTECAIMNNHL